MKVQDAGVMSLVRSHVRLVTFHPFRRHPFDEGYSVNG